MINLSFSFLLTSWVNFIEIQVILPGIIIFFIAGIAFVHMFYERRKSRRKERKLREELGMLKLAHDSELNALHKTLTEQASFAQILSHDIKQPLRNILTYARLIDRKIHRRNQESLEEYTGKLSEEAKMLYDLVEDIYAFSYPDQKRIEKEQVNISEVLRKVSVSLNQVISSKTAKVTFQNMPQIEGNKSQLFILFKNLIENGIKYNLNNPSIEIHYINDGLKHHFRVEDNGIGIPDEYADRVFGLFERLHSRIDFPGSGMGLAICKKIVAGMSGEIWIEESALGGCAVHFSIPQFIATPHPV